MARKLWASVWLEMAGTETRSQQVEIEPGEPVTIAFGDLLPGVIQVVIVPEPDDEEVMAED